MRVGQKRRALEDIFHAGQRSEYAQQTRVNKALRDEMQKKISAVEEFLGTEGVALEGENRDELMLLIDDILQQLSEQEEEITSLQGELDQLLQDMKALEDRSALQEELIQAYQNLMQSQDNASAELKNQIADLVRRLEQPGKKHCAHEPKKQSLEEQRETLLKKINRSTKKRERLLKELAVLSAEATSEKEECDHLSEGENIPGPTEDTNGQAVADPVLEQEAEMPDQKKPAEEPAQEQKINDQEADSAPDNTEEKPVKADYEAELAFWKGEVEALQERLEEEKYQAHMDSTTSSVPPRMKNYSAAKPYTGIGKEDSSDGDVEGEGCQEEEDSIAALEAAAEEAALHDSDKSPNTKRTGRRGKRKGSSGGGRTLLTADRHQEVKCFPSQCEACPHRESCEGFQHAQKFDRPHLTYDIELTRVVTYHQPMRCQCPLDGVGTLTGEYPEGATSWFRFGNGIRSLAVVLNTVGMVSYERIADILRGLIDDDKLCAGSVNSWVREAAEKLHPTVRYIKAGVFSGEYLHSDESGVHVKGALHWVHTACNMAFVYMRVDKQRGEAAMKRIGILPEYMGTLITDCWSSYWGMGSKHGLCIAHLLRELLALVKYFSRDAEWAQEMMDLLYEMNEKRNARIDEKKTEFEKEELEDFYTRYDEIVEKGLKIHPDSEAKKGKRGRAKQYRGRNLLDRLKEHKENFLLFLVDFDCPFTNNLAERSLRLFSIKRAVVGSFDTYEGADDFALIWSYIATAKRRDLNTYEAIRAALEGEATSFMFGEEEIKELDEVLEHLDQKNLEQFLQDKEADEKHLDCAREKADKKRKLADKREQAYTEKERQASAAEAEAREARHMADQLASLGGPEAVCAEAKASKAEEIAQVKREKAEKAKLAASSSREKAKKEEEKVEALAAQVAWNIRAAAYFLEIPAEYWEDIPA